MNDHENLALLLREFASHLVSADSILSYNVAPLQIQNLVPVLRRLQGGPMPLDEWLAYAGDTIARRGADSRRQSGRKVAGLCQWTGLVQVDAEAGVVSLAQRQELPLVACGNELQAVLDELSPQVVDVFSAYAPEAAELLHRVGFAPAAQWSELRGRFDQTWLFRHKMNAAILDNLRNNLCQLGYWSRDGGRTITTRVGERLDPRGGGSPRMAAMVLLTAWTEAMLGNHDPAASPTTDDLVRLLDRLDLRPGQVREWAARLFTGPGPLSHLFHGQGSREVWQLHLTADSLRTLLSGRLVAWDRLFPALQRLAAAAGAAVLVEAAQDAARCLHAHIRETGATPPDKLGR